ncbi:unnamed protein product, partial [Didymodactylos carnosus]
FYKYLFDLLYTLICVTESLLITITMGERLYQLKLKLISLIEYQLKSFKNELQLDIRQFNLNLFEMKYMTITIPSLKLLGMMEKYDDETTNANIILQKNLNLKAERGQCVLITGSTGCGKTSLFRICAGLWPCYYHTTPSLLQLPERHSIIFVPQRPYLPEGTLRFQTTFLLERYYNSMSNGPTRNNDSIRQRKGLRYNEIEQLFKLVNMGYLLKRYDLDIIYDWPSLLSIGEQQRISFIRLFALFTYYTPPSSQLHLKYLIMFDESTSAIDIETEKIIYCYMKEKLKLWFITISHRQQALIKYHDIEFKLYTSKQQEQQNEIAEVELSSVIFPDSSTRSACNDDKRRSIVEENQYPVTAKSIAALNTCPSSSSPLSSTSSTVAASPPRFTNSNNIIDIYTDKLNSSPQCSSFILFKIWTIIHLPYINDSSQHHRCHHLRIQTYLAWLCTLTANGCYTYLSYRLVSQLGYVFSVLNEYSATTVTLQTSKECIRNEALSLTLHTIGIIILYR